jgi:hypothetical protein
MTVFDGARWRVSISLSNPGDNACEAPPEQNPPQSISCISGVCIARLSGMASMFSSTAKQAIQGLMRLNEDMSEVGK